MKIIDLAIRGVPVLTPVPTAFVVASTVIEILEGRGWIFWIALVPALAVALAIEGLGFGTMDVAMQMRDYNSLRRKRFDLKSKQVVYRDPQAPVGLAYVVAGIYILVALMFTVLTDVLPQLQGYVFGVLPFLSALGAFLYALRSDHDRRVAALQQSKVEEKEERGKKRIEKEALKLSEKVRKVSEPIENKPETYGQFKNWHQVPVAHQKEIARRMRTEPKVQVCQWIQRDFGTSEKVAYNWMKYAERDHGEGRMENAEG